VVIQDRVRLYRESLRLVLDAHLRVAVCGTVATIDDLERAVGAEPADAVVLECGGVPWDVGALAVRLRVARPGMVLVGTFPTGSRRPSVEGVAALARTASGRAFADALTGTGAAPGAATPSTGSGHGSGRADLTRRELQVLALIGGGLTTRQIADRLRISTKTVEGRRQTLFTKLGVQSQSQAVSVAMRSGILGHQPAPVPTGSFR